MRADRRWLGLLLILLIGCPAQHEPLPRIRQLPAFTLIDQDGRSFGAGQLRGRVWVANFIFTRCPTVCPLLSRRMAQLARGFRDAPKARFVSISIDPEADTPAVLRRYAHSLGANTQRWHFLTGKDDKLRRVVAQGFRLNVGQRVQHDQGAGYDILHATHFVLVDAKGWIRGYYRKDKDTLAQLQRDMRRLLDGET
ncbi:MAG: SCO family protein [Polyangiales bacterium]